MFCEAYIEVAGWISKEPEFTVNKQGVPYCKFQVSTTNNTSGDDSFLKFSCFLWQGQQYNLLKQLNLAMKDEVVIKGMFSMSQKMTNYGTYVTNLQCYVNYIKVIRSQAAERARYELNNPQLQQIPVQQKVKVNKNQEVEIDKNDRPFD